MPRVRDPLLGTPLYPEPTRPGARGFATHLYQEERLQRITANRAILALKGLAKGEHPERILETEPFGPLKDWRSASAAEKALAASIKQ